MDTWRTSAKTWLASERDGQEDAAEQAFAQAVQALPRVGPRADFTDRVVGAVWSAELGRRRAARWAQGVAALLVVAVGLAVGFVAADDVGAWLATTGAAVLSRGVVRLTSVVEIGIAWWSVAARVGVGVGTAISTPQNMAALIGLELLGMVALLGLRRLLPTEQGALNPSVEART